MAQQAGIDLVLMETGLTGLPAMAMFPVVYGIRVAGSGYERSGDRSLQAGFQGPL